MKYTRKHILASYYSLLGVFALVLFAPRIQDGSTLRLLASQQTVGTPIAIAEMYNTPEMNSQQLRIANRLQNRLFRSGRITPPLTLLKNAVAQRQAYLRRHVSMHIKNSEGIDQGTIEVSLNAYPLWLMPNFSLTNARFDIDINAVTDHLLAMDTPGAYVPENITLLSIEKNEDVFRVQTSGSAKRGEQLDAPSSAEMLIDALKSGEDEISIQLQNVPGLVQNTTEEDLGELALLASGRSNFAGSTYARTKNVQNALRTHVNNTLVPPGTTFSFNSTLGGPVTESRGWSVAQVIFEGDQLRPAAGGGICQASTTVYRAIVNAGFPVVERRAHSLYVSYYKEYGVGIDATIFPGSQDLVFLNDTKFPLLIQAYDDGYEAVVNIYGTSDGRSVELKGPYFSTNAPEGFTVFERSLLQNEVAWVQVVTFPDGNTQKNIILSRYKALPLYVKNEFALVE